MTIFHFIQVMQLDAHCLFVRHWDSLIIKQWQDTKNEMAVLRFVSLLEIQLTFDVYTD